MTQSPNHRNSSKRKTNAGRTTVRNVIRVLHRGGVRSSHSGLKFLVYNLSDIPWHPMSMYASLCLPWSAKPSAAETAYKLAGLVKTQGTVFILPPSFHLLKKTFNSPPKAKSRMSAGAVALCKHFERGGASSEHGRPHPFWPLPKGSNENKTQMAAQVLDMMLDDAQWKNVMMLHPGVAVYEIRNSLGYGMRWTLEVEDASEIEAPEGFEAQNPINDNKASSAVSIGPPSPSENRTWDASRISFRGFLEPIMGLDQELPGVETLSSESINLSTE